MYIVTTRIILKTKEKKEHLCMILKHQEYTYNFENILIKTFTNLFTYVCLLKYLDCNKYANVEFYQNQPTFINHLPQQLNSLQNVQQQNQAYKFQINISSYEASLILPEIKIMNIQQPYLISVNWYNLIVASEKGCLTGSIS